MSARETKILGIIERGGTYVNTMNKLQTEHIARFKEEFARINESVTQSNNIKDAVNLIYEEMNAHVGEMNSSASGGGSGTPVADGAATDDENATIDSAMAALQAGLKTAAGRVWEERGEAARSPRAGRSLGSGGKAGRSRGGGGAAAPVDLRSKLAKR